MAPRRLNYQNRHHGFLTGFAFYNAAMCSAITCRAFFIPASVGASRKRNAGDVTKSVALDPLFNNSLIA
jgi:hypothetical protein